MSNQVTTYNKTNFLKGVAIISVLINHYVNNYLSGDFFGYANGMISIFFLLSGYGIFYSLVKKHNNSSFYLKRVLRIYPLYIISLMFYGLFTGESYSLFTYIAFPFQASGIYWFITSIIQCYILAPLVYAMLQRLGNKNYFLVLTAILLLTQFVTIFLNIKPTQQYFGYRFMVGGHLFLFFFGICIPNLQLPSLSSKRLFIVLSGVVFLGSLYFTSPTDINLLFKKSGLYFSSIFILSCFLFVYSIEKNQDLSLDFSLINLFGKYAFSIYLFHQLYYGILTKIGLIHKQSLLSVFVTIICFPLFFLGCFFAEKISSVISKNAMAFLTKS